MPISLNPSARYVTQSTFFSGANPLGPLTDKRIAYYAKQGRYGPIAHAEEVLKVKVKHKKTKNPFLRF